MKPLVYVAGPYSHPDPVENTHKAIHVATLMLDDGRVAPVVPHLTLAWHLLAPRPYEVWLELDAEVLRRCDAVLRLPGESSGAELEVDLARVWSLPVFDSVPRVLAWADTWDRQPSPRIDRGVRA